MVQRNIFTSCALSMFSVLIVVILSLITLSNSSNVVSRHESLGVQNNSGVHLLSKKFDLYLNKSLPIMIKERNYNNSVESISTKSYVSKSDNVLVSEDDAATNHSTLPTVISDNEKNENLINLQEKYLQNQISKKLLKPNSYKFKNTEFYSTSSTKHSEPVKNNLTENLEEFKNNKKSEIRIKREVDSLFNKENLRNNLLNNSFYHENILLTNHESVSNTYLSNYDIIFLTCKNKLVTDYLKEIKRRKNENSLTLTAQDLLILHLNIIHNILYCANNNTKTISYFRDALDDLTSTSNFKTDILPATLCLPNLSCNITIKAVDFLCTYDQIKEHYDTFSLNNKGIYDIVENDRQIVRNHIKKLVNNFYNKKNEMVSLLEKFLVLFKKLKVVRNEDPLYKTASSSPFNELFKTYKNFCSYEQVICWLDNNAMKDENGNYILNVLDMHLLISVIGSIAKQMFKPIEEMKNEDTSDIKSYKCLIGRLFTYPNLVYELLNKVEPTLFPSYTEFCRD